MSAPNMQSPDFRAGAGRGLAERCAALAEMAADDIVRAWAICACAAEQTGAEEPKAIAGFLRELVRLAVAAEMVELKPVVLSPDIIEFMTDMGLADPGPVQLPAVTDTQDFAAGVRSGMIRARLLTPKPRRKFRRK